MTSRQAKHQAKQRADGAVTISVTFRADEPETAQWAKLVEQEGGPKAAIKRLLQKSTKDLFFDMPHLDQETYLLLQKNLKASMKKSYIDLINERIKQNEH